MAAVALVPHLVFGRQAERRCPVLWNDNQPVPNAVWGRFVYIFAGNDDMAGLRLAVSFHRGRRSGSMGIAGGINGFGIPGDVSDRAFEGRGPRSVNGGILHSRIFAQGWFGGDM
jgi:hypothetical protein